MMDTQAQQPIMQNKLVQDATLEVRKGFVQKVYSILTVQLVLTVAIATPFQFMDVQGLEDNVWLLYVSTALLIACMCSMLCCAKAMRQFPTNYLLLLGITASMGVLVGYSSAQYTWQSVLLAVAITVVIFAAMTVYAWTTKTDFTGFGPYIFAAVMVLSVFGLVLTIMALCGVYVPWLVALYDVLGVLLFTFYIVFDTQLILGAWGGHKNQFGIDDYAFASLSLYLDIINLFLHLLSLFGKRR
eukprot:NODE_14024_length_1133_cov_3.738569.p2 GENE.NODE_14024_length_1133_cov_3.738569~~NODE_14024_length_1133_cov_3.738569.p2  ORF type:complete len:243 (+),score=62.15 NODE_14024_length_1133_cov_3.738569:90-818(+)